MNKYWVGVKKGPGPHDVFTHPGEPGPKEYPQYDYVIGPYAKKAEARKRATTEMNPSGMFTDPFCNDGKGRSKCRSSNMKSKKIKKVVLPESTSPRINHMFGPNDTSLELLRERRDMAARDGDMKLAFRCAIEIDKKRGLY